MVGGLDVGTYVSIRADVCVCVLVCTYHVSERAHTAETGVIPDPPGHSRKVHCSGTSSFNGGVT